MPVISQWTGIYGCIRPSIKCSCITEMLKLVAKFPLFYFYLMYWSFTLSSQ